MSERQIGIEEARGKLGGLVDNVRLTGVPMTITRHDKPVVRVVPLGDVPVFSNHINTDSATLAANEDEIEIYARNLQVGFRVFLDDGPVEVTGIKIGRSTDPAMGPMRLLVVTYADGWTDEYGGDDLLTIVNPLVA